VFAANASDGERASPTGLRPTDRLHPADIPLNAAREQNMGFADHIGIDLAEYDERIRTFVPDYEVMLGIAADALRHLDHPAPTILDLGIGTGALSMACLEVRPSAKLIGMDLDPGMIEAARVRLAGRGHAVLRHGNFLEDPLPSVDAMVACIALHHVASSATKVDLYRRIFESLAPGGMLVSADCFPAVRPALSSDHREHWLAHLEQTYSRSEAEAFLGAWAHEDVYFPLAHEVAWLREAGFSVEILWRHFGFAVIAAFRDRPLGTS
jgi:tRNA (cmo5U34)-methyltransferase